VDNFDTRITILIPVISYNEFNESIETFQEFSIVWASRKDATTSESLRASEIGSKLSARFVIRWSAMSARIDTRFRIAHSGQAFDITGVRAIGRRDRIEIDAAARAESGEVFEVSSP
jgi:SPP1 family predicted phage head-tail adaptor